MLFRLTYPIELVGFFFVAGFTFNTKDSWRVFLQKKIRAIVFPLLLLGFINILCGSLYKCDGNFFERVIGLLVQIPGKWDELWFLACLFVMELVYFTIARISYRSYYLMDIVVAVFFVLGFSYSHFSVTRLPWHIENALIFLPFIHIGKRMKDCDFFGRFLSFFRLNRSLALVVLFLLFGAYLISVFMINNSGIDIHMLNFGSCIAFFCSALVGSFLVCLVAVLMDCAKCRFRLLQYVGRNSLLYYAFQSKVITFVVVLWTRLGYDSHSFVGCILVCFLVCLLLSIPTYLVMRICPRMVGKQRYQSSII